MSVRDRPRKNYSPQATTANPLSIALNFDYQTSFAARQRFQLGEVGEVGAAFGHPLKVYGPWAQLYF